MQGRPRRSVLYMPGSNARALEKAKTIAADAFIFDLEDAVAPDAKLLAREQVCAAVKGGGYGGREIVIRVNALETPWGVDDLLPPARPSPTPSSCRRWCIPATSSARPTSCKACMPRIRSGCGR
jgi:citrate lyase subunit beta/citryl-CoA lyase